MGQESDLEAAATAEREDFTNEPSGHSVTFGEMEKAAAKTHNEITSSMTVANTHGNSQPPLSVVSKKYDLDKKGYLDENEKVMRQYDENNDGTLDMHEVYKIVEEVRKQQADLNDERKKILNLKKVIIGLVSFTLILTLAMLGVSFAAAILAKDTRVNPSSGVLESKSTGEGVSTVGSVHKATMTHKPTIDTGRKLHGRKGQSLASLSPNPNNMKRNIFHSVRNAARRQHRRRHLQTVDDDFSPSSDTEDDDCNDDSNDDCTGVFSYGIDGSSLDDLCDDSADIDFNIDVSNFKRIRNAYFTNMETSIVMQIEEDEEWYYQYTMNIMDGYLVNIDEEVGVNEDVTQQVMLLFTQERLTCASSGKDAFSQDFEDLEDTYESEEDADDCYHTQPFFIFESCDDDDDDDDCAVRTCNYGVGSSVRLRNNADAAGELNSREL